MSIGHDTVAGLYLQEAPNLRRYLTRKLGAIDDAQDVVQDAYVRMLSSRVEEKTLNSPRSFLFTVALNLAIDSIRRRRRERRVLDIVAEPVRTADGVDLELVCPQRRPDLQVDDQIRIDHVLTCLGELSPKCRQAFVLHKFMDQSYAEVAETLGVTVSMVEKYLSRALRCVRSQAIGGELGDYS